MPSLRPKYGKINYGSLLDNIHHRVSSYFIKTISISISQSAFLTNLSCSNQPCHLLACGVPPIVEDIFTTACRQLAHEWKACVQLCRLWTMSTLKFATGEQLQYISRSSYVPIDGLPNIPRERSTTFGFTSMPLLANMIRSRFLIWRGYFSTSSMLVVSTYASSECTVDTPT